MGGMTRSVDVMFVCACLSCVGGGTGQLTYKEGEPGDGGGD